MHIRAVITRECSPRQHEPGNQTAKVQNLRSCGWGDVDLVFELGAANASSDGDGDEGGDPGVALVPMQDGVAAEGDEQSKEGDDDDADGWGDCFARGDGTEGHAADYSIDYAKASEGGKIEEDENHNEVFPMEILVVMRLYG